MGRINVWLLFLIIGLGSCSKYDKPVDNLNNGEIWKMGHGGMGISSAYPMNTREALLQCLSFDMDGTELDVQMTSDGILVAFHDETMDSKTNFTGRINDYTWEELKEMRYTINPNLRFELLKLEDLFAMTETNGKHFAFDLKLYHSSENTGYDALFCLRLTELIDEFSLEDRCWIESGSPSMLDAIRVVNPNLELYYYPSNFDEGMEVILAHQFDGITISHKELSKEKVSYAHGLGIKVITWNTNTKKENKLAVSYQVDGIETDRVEFLSKYLP